MVATHAPTAADDVFIDAGRTAIVNKNPVMDGDFVIKGFVLNTGNTPVLTLRGSLKINSTPTAPFYVDGNLIRGNVTGSLGNLELVSGPTFWQLGTLRAVRINVDANANASLNISNKGKATQVTLKSSVLNVSPAAQLEIDSSTVTIDSSTLQNRGRVVFNGGALNVFNSVPTLGSYLGNSGEFRTTQTVQITGGLGVFYNDGVFGDVVGAQGIIQIAIPFFNNGTVEVSGQDLRVPAATAPDATLPLGGRSSRRATAGENPVQAQSAKD
jgi:hypothetical protein